MFHLLMESDGKQEAVTLMSFVLCLFLGEMVTKQPLIRSMRTVKRETLKLISGWVSRSNDPQMVGLFSWFLHAPVINS